MDAVIRGQARKTEIYAQGEWGTYSAVCEVRNVLRHAYIILQSAVDRDLQKMKNNFTMF